MKWHTFHLLVSILHFLAALCGAQEFGRPQIHFQTMLYEGDLDTERHVYNRVSFDVSAHAIQTHRPGLARRFSTPPDVRDYCLESDDYDNSGLERGHSFALLFCRDQDEADQSCFMMAVSPQYPDVNAPVISSLEEHIATLAQTARLVQVEITTEFGKTSAPLPNADEPYMVPSAFEYTLQYKKHYGTGTLTSFEYYRIPNVPNVLDMGKTFRDFQTAGRKD